MNVPMQPRSWRSLGWRADAVFQVTKRGWLLEGSRGGVLVLVLVGGGTGCEPRDVEDEVEDGREVKEEWRVDVVDADVDDGVELPDVELLLGGLRSRAIVGLRGPPTSLLASISGSSS